MPGIGQKARWRLHRRALARALGTIVIVASGWLLPATVRAAGMVVKSGTYAGNGTDNRSIFVGFRPDIVIVDIEAPVTAAPDEAVIRTSSMAGDRAKDMDSPNAPVANKIQSLDPTGFTLGTHVTVNGVGVTYHWVAFRAAPGTLKVGFYVGDGVTDNRSITGIGFQPEYVIVMPNNAARVLHRTSNMPVDLAHDFESLGAADTIQDFEADGFQVGLNPAVNANNVTYYYAAWSVTPGEVAVGVYTGDGTDNRNIVGLGFAPEHVIVNRSAGAPGPAGNPPAHKMASTGVAVDKALIFEGRQWEADNIQALQANGFQVGLHVRVNAGAAPNTYYWVAFGPRAPTTNYRSIGTAAPYGTGTIALTAGSTAVTGAGTAWRINNRGRGDVMTIPCPDPPTCTGGVDYTVASLTTDADLQLTQGYAGATAAGVTYLLRRQFTTLAAWENCIDGPTGAGCTFFPASVGSLSLVTDDRSEVGIAYKDTVFAPGGTTVINGSITNATHTITLTADPGNRHFGLLGNGVVVDMGALPSDAFQIQDDYVTVEWLEVKGGSGTGFLLDSASATNQYVLRNLLVHNMGEGMLFSDAQINADLYNNIVFGVGVGINFEINPTLGRMFNNTVYNCGGEGFRGVGGSNYLVSNNISHSNAGAEYSFPGVLAGSTQNLSQTTAPGALPINGVPLASMNFVSTTPGAENLHIREGSAAENNGADLSAIFTADIDDELRRTPWDCGADDVRGVVNYRSIGTDGTAYTTGTANAVSGSPIVMGTGGTAWLANNRGRGDVITIPCPVAPACAGGVHYTILGVSADNQLALTTPFAGATGPYTYAIRRQFATLAAWENCIDGPTGAGCTFFPASVANASLVADDRSEVGIAYKDGPLARVTIGASAITDALHTITLTADPGNRHLGIPGNGVVVDNGINPLAVVLIQNDFVTVEWLEVIGGVDEGVEWDTASPGSNQGIARNLLVHNITLEGILLDDANLNADVYNNIVYTTETGIRVGTALVTGTIRVFNNTVYTNLVAGITAAGSNPSVTLVNNISHSNGTDFSVPGLNGASRNNLASTGTGPLLHSPGGGGLDSVPLASLMFVDPNPGTEDLHIQAGSAAENNGADLRSVFNLDIDLGLRQLPWDRGADDIGATTAVTLSSFTASPADAAVDLFWTTASELRNLGFHLYRSDSEGGPYTRITSSLIPGLGSSPTGQSYSYRDSGLVNGRTYYYELEDVETTGRTERHGPVSVVPTAGGSPPPNPGASGTSYGDPTSIVLREVERSASHVVLELLTGGFEASPAEDGRVRLRIPGFESVSRPGEPSLPMRRSFVEAVSGRKVRLTSVLASEELRFPGLRPVPAGARGIEVGEEGTVLTSEEKRQDGPGFERLFPEASALLLGTSFQEETKKAEVLFFPLRWDGSGLTLSRRLLVRLEFSGKEKQETSRGGSRGRRRVERPSRTQTGVVAQVVVRERGLQRVDYEGLFGSEPGRRGRGLPESSLRLSRQGKSVAFHVEPQGALFGPGSSLYFVSEGPDLNPYGDAVYELEANTTNRGLRMGVEGVVSTSRATSRAVSEYFPEVRVEENHYYQAGLLEAPDLWLWDVVVSPGSKSFAFAVSDLAASSSVGRLSVVMQGASDFEGVLDHHVRVSVNGRFVGETVWDGKQPTTLELELEPGVLQEGPNTLELEDVGDAGALYSMVFLNRFRVSYPRRLVASQGKLEGRFESSGQAEIEGASPSSFVLDTTDVPRWLVGASGTANGLSLSVQGGRSYLVTATVVRPEVRRLQASRLKSPTNRADYLLLGPQAFLGAAQPLLDLRESQGLLTKVASLEEVYEQFGHGEVGPEAIKEFLEYAYHFWAAPSPRYVLLLGDASYDPKNYLGTGVKDRLPGFPVKTSYLWTVSDPVYASVNGEDLLPDIAIGRLPAGSLDEALRMVEKTLSYENGGGTLDGPAVLVADNADLGGNFEQDADEIASTVLASRNPRKIYYSQEGASTRAKIEEAFDAGASLMSYMGHGGTVVWASENIFNYQDVQTLAPQSQQPLLMTMNCLNGFFQFPPFNSLSEALLKAEGKGVIGAFSPSGLSVNGAAHLFHKALLEEIVSGRHERIGDAILAAQERYAQTGAFPEILSIYHLLGDPALRIR